MALEILKAVIVGTRKGYVLPRETEVTDGMELIQFPEGEELVLQDDVQYDPDNDDGFHHQ